MAKFESYTVRNMTCLHGKSGTKTNENKHKSVKQKESGGCPDSECSLFFFGIFTEFGCHKKAEGKCYQRCEDNTP